MGLIGSLSGLDTWAFENRGIDCDGLYMYSGGWGAPTRVLIARRDGDDCELGIAGRNSDLTREYGVVPSQTFHDKVIARIPPLDWDTRYDSDVDDGYEWSLHVIWDGWTLVRSSGHEAGPDGYRTVINLVEEAFCPLLGVAPRMQSNRPRSDRMFAGVPRRRRRD